MLEEKETSLDAEQTAAKGELSDKDVGDVAGGAQLQKVVSGSTSIEVTGMLDKIKVQIKPSPVSLGTSAPDPCSNS